MDPFVTLVTILLVMLGVLLVFIPLVKKYLYEKKWARIELLNQDVHIDRENAYLDKNGYLRWKANDRLCHRDIAFDAEAADGNRVANFGTKDVHHKDGNKWNNDPDNLEILSRETHQLGHGQVIYENGRKYIKLAHVRKIYRETDKAILVARRWLPKSQILVKDGIIYLPEWLYKQRFGSDIDN